MNKVKVGFFSFTEITDPAEHRSYNEWHQLDHMPEQYPLPGMAFGQRWVSSPPCRAARAVDGPLLAAVHYVTLYLMTEPVETTLEQFQALGGELRRRGRFHEHRRALLSGPFDVETIDAAPRVLVSAEAVPYRPNTGAYVIVEDDLPSPTPGHPSRLDALRDVDGVAGLWTFTSRPGPGGVGPAARRRVTVCFLDDDPLVVSSSMHVVLDGADDGVIHAGPLEAITPWQWGWFDGEGAAQS